MARSVFLDPAAAPNNDEVARALGSSALLWSELCGWLLDAGARGEYRWGGARYGWEFVVRRAGRPMATLTPQDGSFVVLVVLGRTEGEAARALELEPRVGRLLAETPRLHDGQWLYLPVGDRLTLRAVIALLELKLPRTVRTRLSRAA